MKGNSHFQHESAILALAGGVGAGFGVGGRFFEVI
jgi:hypothetical protein